MAQLPCEPWLTGTRGRSALTGCLSGAPAGKVSLAQPQLLRRDSWPWRSCSRSSATARSLAQEVGERLPDADQLARPKRSAERLLKQMADGGTVSHTAAKRPDARGVLGHATWTANRDK